MNETIRAPSLGDSHLAPPRINGSWGAQIHESLIREIFLYGILEGGVFPKILALRANAKEPESRMNSFGNHGPPNGPLALCRLPSWTPAEAKILVRPITNHVIRIYGTLVPRFTYNFLFVFHGTLLPRFANH